MDNSWYTIEAAAKELKVSTKTIRRHIKSGRLTAQIKDGKYFIAPNSVQTCPAKKIDKVDSLNNTGVYVDREHYEALLIRIGQLEQREQLLLEHKAEYERLREENQRLKSAGLFSRIFRKF